MKGRHELVVTIRTGPKKNKYLYMTRPPQNKVLSINASPHVPPPRGGALGERNTL